MDQRFGQVDKRFDWLQNASRNWLRCREHEEINPVGKLNENGEMEIPRELPRTVRDFWKLRLPANSLLLLSHYQDSS